MRTSIRKIVRSALNESQQRDDDYDVLRRDKRAWRELMDVFRGADDHPEDYEWRVTSDGYIGKGKAATDDRDYDSVDDFGYEPDDEPQEQIESEFVSLSWDGLEWTVGDWEWD